MLYYISVCLYPETGKLENTYVQRRNKKDLDPPSRARGSTWGLFLQVCCLCLSGIVFILTAKLLHSCLGTTTTSVFRFSVQVHRVRRSTGRSGVQVNRVRRSTGRSGVQVHGVRRSRHVEGRNYAALLEIGASPRGRCPPLGLLSPPTLSLFRVCFLLYDVN